ncbi:unnamed protein product [Linum tenue]|uniref:Replication protein A 70 kDa DNA-binding subunit B/D first OB fold domain-containing protein n=1 Tax=Linum tenue TaxID=586396 RepID=A0AAV0GZV0_9ROSI|nr:unnamed protein product [Linum tenue]
MALDAQPLELNSIRDLSVQKRAWNIQFRVSRMWLAINPNTNETLHLDLVILDAQGDTIWVQISEDLIKTFQPKLKEQQVYIFKDFKVILAPQSLQYRLVLNRLLIHFTPTTIVEEVVENILPIPAYHFDFIKEREIHSRCDQRRYLPGMSSDS